MADNTTLNSGSGGNTCATDDIGGVHYQRVKPSLGADGTAVDAIPISNGLDTTATGVQAVGVVGQLDDTATGAVTENQFAPIRISTRRALLVEGVASGTNVNVNINAAIPAGANNIGTVELSATALAALETITVATVTAALPAGTNNIGDVDVLSVVPGTGAADLGKAEDAAHTTGDVGVMAMTVRQNTAAALSGTDGDYQPLITDTNGRLHVIGNTTESGSQVLADDAAFTPGTTRVVMAGYEADETATDSVDEGDGGAARMTLDRKVIVTPQPHTSGGLSTMNATSSDGATALTNTAQVISAAAGQLYGYYIYNPNAAAAFVQFYNTAAASVTVGTTAPLFMLTIPSGSAANLMGAHGIAFSNAGWSWAATSTAGGSGALTTALDAVAWYK